jgi:hypothetical protein
LLADVNSRSCVRCNDCARSSLGGPFSCGRRNRRIGYDNDDEVLQCQSNSSKLRKPTLSRRAR